MTAVKVEIDTKQWDLAKAVLTFGEKQVTKTLEKAIHIEAQYLAKMVKQRIRTGPFQALSPLTIAARKLNGFGGTKPLNVSGELKGAVTVTPAGVGGLEKFVGVLKTVRAQTSFKARGGPGAYLANIGQIMEEGRTILIKVTPKMRKFLFGVLFKKGGRPTGASSGAMRTGILVVHIPARPFIGPVFEEEGPKVVGRIGARLYKAFEAARD